jgi:translation elongation factor EF-Tu-like GTPase
MRDMIDPTKPDLRAAVTLLSSDSGRKSPVMSGYRPNHRFGDRREINDALHTYEKDGWVQLGESVGAALSLSSPERLAGKLYVGMPFTVQEGGKIVGGGVITQILNPIVARPSDPGRESGGSP